MHVLLLAPGSRGDVEPAARIGHDLTAAGHSATIVAHRDYADIVERARCRAVTFTTPLNPPPGPNGTPPGARAYLAHLRGYMRDAAATALRAANPDPDAARPPVDAIITNAVSPYGHAIADSLGVPSTTALLQPERPSRAYPPMIASQADLGPLGNLALGHLLAAMPSPVRAASNWVRKQVGAPAPGHRGAARRRGTAPVHHGISPLLMARPADWPDALTLDGVWWPVPRPDWRPDSALGDFLAAGPAPVVITMGSAGVTAAAAAALADAVAGGDLRFVVQGSGWDRAVATAGDRALQIGDAPHEWLLPRAAACVHQAGAGVSAACIRAGIPSVPLPQHTDQFFWSRRLQALGAAVPAPRPGPATTADMTSAIARAANDAQLRRSARALSRRLAGEEGLTEWPGGNPAAASGATTHASGRPSPGTEEPAPVLRSTAGLRSWAARHA